jgi:hypothetical protein
MTTSTYEKLNKIVTWLLGIGWVVLIIVGIVLSLASVADVIDIITKEDNT